MTEQTTRSSGSTVAADVTAAGDRMAEEGRALSGTMAEAKDAVAAEARDLRDQTADRLGAGAESVKEEAVAGLTAFSEALRSASDELSGKDLGLAGDMVRQAAGGLEGFVRALEGRSPGEMIEGVRAFGRENPVGFIAGSVLAGFALGRVAAVVPAGAGGAAATGASERSAAPAGYAPAAPVSTAPGAPVPTASAGGAER
jgi:hypothetical protein